MAYNFQNPLSNNGRRSQVPLTDNPRRSSNLSSGNYNYYEGQDLDDPTEYPPRRPQSSSQRSSPMSEGEGHYDFATYGGEYPPSPVSDYRHTSFPGSGRTDNSDDDTMARLHRVPQYTTPSPLESHKIYRDGYAADVLDQDDQPSTPSEYPPYDEKSRVRKFLPKITCILICLVIISIIVVVVIGLINFLRCKNLSYTGSNVYTQDVFIVDAPNGGRWNFSMSGKFFEKNLNSHTTRSTNNSVHVQTHMISAKGGDVFAFENHDAAQYTFFHETPVKSPDWKNYLVFPPICAKVQVDIWYPQPLTFDFILDEFGFDVSNVN